MSAKLSLKRVPALVAELPRFLSEAFRDIELMFNVLDTSEEVWTNKTLDDYTNDIHADAVHRRVKNASGGTITAGQPLAFDGYNAGEDAVEVILADNTLNVAIGLAEGTTENGEFFLMTVSGIMEKLDTSAHTEGTILYVNGAGILTATEPTSGFSQPIAFVLRAHAINGALQTIASYPKQSADDVRYSGTLTSTNVQDALNELHALIP